MLIRMVPDKVAEKWDIMKGCIHSALPPTSLDTEVHMTNILEAILCGKMVCWAFEVEEQVKYLIVTQVIEDDVTHTRNFFVFALVSILPVTMEEWQEGFITLQTYAKYILCDLVSAYTKNPRIMQIVKHLGGDVETRYLQMPL